MSSTLESALMWTCVAMPHSLLTSLGDLPGLPGVYVVYQGVETLYVGKTRNLQRRWRAHHRRDQFATFGADVFLAWLPLPASTVLARATYENLLIAMFQPCLNGKPFPSNQPLERSRHFQFDSSKLLVTQQREQRGLSMSEVARRAKMPLTTLWKIEHEERKFVVDEVARLARAIGCQPSDLIPDIPDPIPDIPEPVAVNDTEGKSA